MQAQVGSFVGSELHRIKEDFRQVILSILTASAKDGLTDAELIRDYRSCTGLNLPFTQLGYNSVYELMRSMPDVCYIRRHPAKNILLYYPVETEQTRDIARLVRGQKDTNRATREANRDRELRKNAYQRYHSQNPSQRNFLFDEQYGNRATRNQAATEGFLNGVKILPHRIQNQIRNILERYEEMTVRELEDIYRIEDGFMFNYTQYGFDSFTSALKSLTHIIELESKPGNTNPLVKLIKRDPRNGDRTVPGDSRSMRSASESKPANHSPTESHRESRYEHTSHNHQARKEPPVSMPEEEVVEVLKKIIDANTMGIYPTSLIQSFKKATQKSLDFERFGYDSFNEFLTYKLHGYVGFDYSNKFDEPKIYKLSTRVNGVGDSTTAVAAKDSSSSSSQINVKDKQECLKNIVDKTLTNHKLTQIEKTPFCELFERVNGWKFSPEEYGFSSFDDFLAKFAEEGVFSINIDNKLHPKISYPGANASSATHNGSSSSFDQSRNNTSNETALTIDQGAGHEPTAEAHIALNRKKLQAEYIQNHIVHHMDPNEILRSFAEKSTHRIIISNVTNPTSFQIQLVENNRALDSLMDELEKLYYGIGASHYNMPTEYIQHYGLCAAVFEGDKNWHRCRITGYYKEQKAVRVQFIDYGGNSIVSINDVKFLAKQFDKLPIQAVNARLHNVAPPVVDTWHKNIVDYMLQRVKGKVFSANIVGVIEGVLSIECFQELPISAVDKNSPIELSKKSLNQLIIDEAYAKFYESGKDIEFKEFNSWQEGILKKYSGKSNMSGVSESVISSDKDPARSRQQSQKATCVSLGTQSTDSFHGSPSGKQRAATEGQAAPPDFRNALSPVLSQDQTALLSQNYLTVSADTKMKMKKISIQESYIDATYTLLSINGTMYVYWSDLVGLIGIRETLFKQFILDQFQIQEDDPGVKCLVVKCPFDRSNIAFFRLLRSALGVSSKEIRRDEGAFFCKYKGIYDLCDLALHSVHSEFIKSILLNSYKSKSSNDNSSRKDTLCTELS